MANELKIQCQAQITNLNTITQELQDALKKGLIIDSESVVTKHATKGLAKAQSYYNQGDVYKALGEVENVAVSLAQILVDTATTANGVTSDLATKLTKLVEANKAYQHTLLNDPALKYNKRANDQYAYTADYVREQLKQQGIGLTRNGKAWEVEFNGQSAVVGGTGQVNEFAKALLKLNLSTDQLTALLKSIGFHQDPNNTGKVIADDLTQQREAEIAQHEKELNERLESVQQASIDVKEARINLPTASYEGDNGAHIDTGNELDKVLDIATNASRGQQEVAEQQVRTAQTIHAANEEYARQYELQRQLSKSTTQLTDIQNKNTSSVSRAVGTFFGYQMVLRQVRRLWNDAIRTLKDLDKQLTNQAIVTDLTRQQTWQLVSAYQELGKATGFTTTQIAEVNTEYLRQGNSLKDALVLTEAAAKSARVAGIAATDSVKYLTTALHGFRLEAEQALEVSDKFASLAAQSASNYEDLAIALSKVASQASLAGMSMDYTLALLTTGLDVTQEAPESIGTALKTVIARMREISDYGETLEDGIDINQVEDALKYVNVELRTTNGELRSSEDVLDELGRKWQTLSANQQAAVAKALAGTRQQSRLVAILDNYEDVIKYQEQAALSVGATNAQMQDYLEGMEAATNALSVQYQAFIKSITDNDFIKGVIEVLTKALERITKIFADKSFIGIVRTISTVLLALGSTILPRIAGMIVGIGQKIGLNLKNQKDLNAAFEEGRRRILGQVEAYDQLKNKVAAAPGLEERKYLTMTADGQTVEKSYTVSSRRPYSSSKFARGMQRLDDRWSGTTYEAERSARAAAKSTTTDVPTAQLKFDKINKEQEKWQKAIEKAATTATTTAVEYEDTQAAQKAINTKIRKQEKVIAKLTDSLTFKDGDGALAADAEVGKKIRAAKDKLEKLQQKKGELEQTSTQQQQRINAAQEEERRATEKYTKATEHAAKAKVELAQAEQKAKADALAYNRQMADQLTGPKATFSKLQLKLENIFTRWGNAGQAVRNNNAAKMQEKMAKAAEIQQQKLVQKRLAIEKNILEQSQQHGKDTIEQYQRVALLEGKVQILKDKELTSAQRQHVLNADTWDEELQKLLQEKLIKGEISDAELQDADGIKAAIEKAEAAGDKELAAKLKVVQAGQAELDAKRDSRTMTGDLTGTIANKEAKEARLQTAGKVARGGMAAISAATTLISWGKEIAEEITNGAANYAQEAIEKSQKRQNEIFNNRKLQASIDSLISSTDELNAKFLKSADDLDQLRENREQLIDALAGDGDRLAYERMTEEDLYRKARQRSRELEEKNQQLILDMQKDLLGSLDYGIEQFGDGVMNFLGKTAAGAGIGMAAGPWGALAGAIVGSVTAVIEETVKLINRNNDKERIKKTLEDENGLQQVQTLLQYKFKTAIDQTTKQGEILAKSVESAYASIIDSLDGDELKALLEKYDYDVNRLTDDLTKMLEGVATELGTLNNEEASYAQKYAAAQRVIAAARASGNQAFADSLEESYEEILQIGAVLGATNLDYVDKLHLDTDAVGALGLELTKMGGSAEEVRARFEELFAVLADPNHTIEDINRVTKDWSESAVTAAAKLVASGNTLQTVSEQLTTARSNISGIREAQSNWGEKSAAEKQLWINDNKALFLDEEGNWDAKAWEAFINGADMTPYIERYKRATQERLQEAAGSLITEAQMRIPSLESEIKALEEEMKGLSPDSAEYALKLKTYKELKATLADVNSELAYGNELMEEANNLSRLTLSEVVDKQHEQIEKLKEMYQAEEDALTESLNKRKEAYQRYFDQLEGEEAQADYTAKRDQLISSISSLAGGTDANSRNQMNSLRKQLKQAEEEEAKRRRQEAREAVIQNIDDQVTQISDKFDKLINNNDEMIKSINENTHAQYLAFLAQNGMTPEERELATQQLGDLLKGRWTRDGQQTYNTPTTPTPSVTDVQVDKTNNTFNLDINGGSQSISMNQDQMNRLLSRILDAVQEITGQRISMGGR